jgi:hypothetical protein
LTFIKTVASMSEIDLVWAIVLFFWGNLWTMIWVASSKSAGFLEIALIIWVASLILTPAPLATGAIIYVASSILNAGAWVLLGLF